MHVNFRSANVLRVDIKWRRTPKARLSSASRKAPGAYWWLKRLPQARRDDGGRRSARCGRGGSRCATTTRHDCEWPRLWHEVLTVLRMVGADPTLLFGEKKKKKKKKILEDDLSALTGATGEDAGEDVAEQLAELDLTSLKKKKKKKKVRVDEEMMAEEGVGAEEGEENAETVKSTGLPWEGTDRDYHYEELLGRVFGILRERNPELTGEKRRTIMKPPEVMREGTKKTVFVNFMDLCKQMHRPSEHVLNYMLSELGTSGSLDGQQRLIVKGRFMPKAFEVIIRRYVNEYVLCHACKSPDTVLDREQRLYHLRCQQCGASRTVQAIKSGFVARVGRRPKA